MRNAFLHVLVNLRMLPVLFVLSVFQACHANGQNVLIVVPGFGWNLARLGILEASFKVLFRDTTVEKKCVVYTYKKPVNVKEIQSAKTLLERCDILQYENSMYAFYLKTVSPFLVKTANFSHVMILLDDVEILPTFDLQRMLGIMTDNNLSVASPYVIGNNLCPRKHKMGDGAIGFKVHYSEVFALTFTSQAWTCFWGMLAPQINSNGWGYDVYLHEHCSKKN